MATNDEDHLPILHMLQAQFPEGLTVFARKVRAHAKFPERRAGPCRGGEIKCSRTGSGRAFRRARSSTRPAGTIGDHAPCQPTAIPRCWPLHEPVRTVWREGNLTLSCIGRPPLRRQQWLFVLSGIVPMENLEAGFPGSRPAYLVCLRTRTKGHLDQAVCVVTSTFQG